MQGCRRLILGTQKRLDPAELGFGAGRGNDGTPGPARHDRAAEHHVVTVGDRRGMGCDDIRRLHYRHALAGQHRLVHCQAIGHDDTRVGRDDLVAAQFDEIALHELLGRDFAFLSIAQYPRDRIPAFAEAADSLLGARFGDKAYCAVEADDAEDDCGVEKPASGDRQYGAAGEQRDRQAAKLREQYFELRAARYRRYCIGAGFREPPLCFCVGQSRWMAADRADDIVGIHRVPGGVCGTGRRVRVERPLCGFAQAPGNLDEIVPSLE